MSEPMPTFDEWRRFLMEEMAILDKVWEQDLDDIWTYTTTPLARIVAEIADEFYQAYWEMFRATLQKNDKPWKEMKQEAKAAAKGAEECVSRAWGTVVGDKIDRVERDLDATKDLRASVLKAKQLLRDARAAKSKAEKATTRQLYKDAIKYYRDAIELAIRSDDELEEARRQAGLINEQQKATSITIRLTKSRVIIAAIAVLIALSGLIFGIVNLSLAIIPS